MHQNVNELKKNKKKTADWCPKHCNCKMQHRWELHWQWEKNEENNVKKQTVKLWLLVSHLHVRWTTMQHFILIFCMSTLTARVKHTETQLWFNFHSALGDVFSCFHLILISLGVSSASELAENNRGKRLLWFSRIYLDQK